MLSFFFFFFALAEIYSESYHIFHSVWVHVIRTYLSHHLNQQRLANYTCNKSRGAQQHADEAGALLQEAADIPFVPQE